jgi:polyisoprenoid-binding protein YceI
MKKITLFASAAIAFFAFKPVEPTIWSVDKAHSRLGFSITHLGVNEIEGSSKAYECTITAPKEDFSDASLEMSADVNSINTENEKRDGHLKSEEFFDAVKYGQFTFKSKSFKPAGDKKFKITGEITMHGVTKEITLDALCRTGVNPMSKKPVTGFRITGTIKRSDFNIGTKYPAPMLSDEVELVANGEFAKKEAPAAK